jgi:hypothetical protein
MAPHTEIERYFHCHIAIIDRRLGETKEEALSRHLLANPDDAYAAIKVFNRDSKVRVYPIRKK